MLADRSVSLPHRSMTWSSTAIIRLASAGNREPGQLYKSISRPLNIQHGRQHITSSLHELLLPMG